MSQPTIEIRRGRRRVYLDERTGEWVIEFNDEGNTVVRNRDKQVIEDTLDYADNQQ